MRIELNQHVNVAIWAEILLQDRPEQRQLPDMVALAKCCQALLIKGYFHLHIPAISYPTLNDDPVVVRMLPSAPTITNCTW